MILIRLTSVCGILKKKPFRHITFAHSGRLRPGIRKGGKTGKGNSEKAHSQGLAGDAG
jgi:hypothetical protein